MRLTLFCSLLFAAGAGTKKPLCGAAMGIVGASIGSIGFMGAPDGLKTSTYDFLRAAIE